MSLRSFCIPHATSHSEERTLVWFLSLFFDRQEQEGNLPAVPVQDTGSRWHGTHLHTIISGGRNNVGCCEGICRLAVSCIPIAVHNCPPLTPVIANTCHANSAEYRHVEWVCFRWIFYPVCKWIAIIIIIVTCREPQCLCTRYMHINNNHLTPTYIHRVGSDVGIMQEANKSQYRGDDFEIPHRLVDIDESAYRK